LGRLRGLFGGLRWCATSFLLVLVSCEGCWVVVGGGLRVLRLGCCSSEVMWAAVACPEIALFYLRV
jgi:hypothetical protein